MNRSYPLAMPRPLKKPRPAQGEHLANLRRAAGLTQTALAELIGEPQTTIATWEISARPPRSSVLPKLAKALGVTVEDVLNVKRARSPGKRGPVSKLHKLLDEVSQLPRRQQDRLAEMVSIFLEQERRRAG